LSVPLILLRQYPSEYDLESAILSESMKHKISARISRAISESVFPGCVIAFKKPGNDSVVLAFGHHTNDAQSPAVHENSVFDVASITKAIPTSSLALLSLDRGTLNLDDQLIRYVPEFDNSFREKVLIRHLLTQTLDFDFRLSSTKDLGPDGVLHAIFTAELKHEPGTTFFYSNATSILLGLVVERIFGKRLDAIADEEFFKPLAMDSTSFSGGSFKNDTVVPTENDPWRGKTVQGEVHDESAWVLWREGIVAGSAGLFSTAPDIMIFLEMLLNHGASRGKRYFSDDIIDRMQSNQIDHLGLHAGLGWELFQKRYMGRYCTGQTLGKTGFTGCVCVCDIGKQSAFVLLSNYTFPNRKPDTKTIDEVRRDIADIILS
jgi:CubicO group peptidase (beta-lactamase class C family)